MWLLLELIVLAVIALMTFLGINRGFIKSVTRLLSLILAFVFAMVLSSTLSAGIYNAILFEPLDAMVHSSASDIATHTEQTLQEQIDHIMNDMPELLKDASVYQNIETSGNSMPLPSEQLAAFVMDHIVSPLCITILEVVLFLILFLVLFLVFKLASSIIDKLFAAVAIVKKPNEILGGILGFFEGIAVVLVLCIVLEIYMALVGSYSIITPDDIKKTVLLEFFINHNFVF